MQREPIAKRRALFVYTFSPLSRKESPFSSKKKCDILLYTLSFGEESFGLSASLCPTAACAWGRNSSFLLAMLAFKHVSSATTIAPSNHSAPLGRNICMQMHFPPSCYYSRLCSRSSVCEILPRLYPQPHHLIA